MMNLYLETGSESFDTFLEILGDKVPLKGFQGFKAGLDVEKGQTGLEIIHTHWRNFEITYHVSTLLPYFADDDQQIQRKRHIGNGILFIGNCI
jgi:hypothetical protein